MDIAKLVARLELQSSQFQSEIEKTNKAILGLQRTSNTSLSSIDKQFKTFGRNLKSTISGVNLALTAFAGVGLKKAFQGIFTETAANSKEFASALDDVKRSAKDLLSSEDGAPAAAAALRDLAETLKDPAVQKAADDLTSTLIRGFAAAVQGTAKMVGGLQVVLGLTGNQVEDINNRIEALEASIAQARISDAKSGTDSAAFIAEQRRQIEVLKKAQLAVIDHGPAPRGQEIGLPNDAFLGVSNFQVDDLNIDGVLQKQMADFQRVQNMIEGSFDPLDERMTKMVEDFDSNINEGVVDSAQQAAQSIGEVGDALGEKILGKTQELSIFAEEAARNMQGAFADFLFDPFEGGLKGMLKGFIDVLRRMVAEAAAAQIFEKVFGSGGSGLSGLGSLFSSFLGGGGGTGSGVSGGFSGPRADGGRVSGGRSYLVGERGPEMFTPNISGSIVPNHSLGGGGVNVTQNISGLGVTAEQLGPVLDRNNRQLVQMIQRGQSQSGQSVTRF